MSDNEEETPTITEVKNETLSLEKSDQPTVIDDKPKKPRTEKQMEAFRIAQSKRQENIRLKNEAKMLDKMLAKSASKTAKTAKTISKKIEPPSPSESESEEEEEIIYVKSQKKKPKKKTVVIEDSSESEEEEPTPPPTPKASRSKFTPQLNKKSNITIAKPSMFCD